MTAERTFSPDDPHAAPHVGGVPYSIERRTFARIPCLVERPSVPVRALLIAYHGAGAAKEGKLGVYSALTAQGVAIVIPDAPLHGERTLSQPGLNHREFVWESARRSVAEAEAFFTVLQDEFGKLPIFVVGSSMGGYVALALARSEKRVRGAAALITSGVWQEPEVNAPGTRAFLEAQRPLTHTEGYAPTPLLLLSGEIDPVFPLSAHHVPTAAALKRAYEAAGCTEHFSEKVYPGVEHYTSQKMRDDVVTWTLALLSP
ncbi:hydrolase [Deinococcus irradiatisoli]|uniref:Hydrolase n=1 Tax=Deinococcus irradiatisoli TaxID=2202254 RepID=A0A2Z3JCU7_9DEIO|nr:alpha/beta fold hydrolase [Deinococcus irradiatisoli]AWN21866.1 hydrolase [Deinococcus irradiatisoli]